MRKYEKRQEANCLRLEIKTEAQKEIKRIETALQNVSWFRIVKRILLRIELIHFEKVYLSAIHK